MRRDGEKGACVNQREKEASREVVGGSGPYREAGTTLASAILSARNTHNHLVPLALSLTWRTCCCCSSFPPRRCSTKRSDGSFEGERKGEPRERPLESSASSFSSWFRTPSTSYYFPRFGSLTRSGTSGISRAHSERETHRRETKFRLRLLRGRVSVLWK